MNFSGYDIYFPNLGIGIENLRNSISVFGYRIAFYGIIIACGMLLGILAARTDYKRNGGNPEDIDDFALVVIVLSVLGARLYYVIFQWDYYSSYPLEILNIHQGGLAIYGGVLTAMLTCIIWTHFKHENFFKVADSCVIGLILGQAIGRWGNFFNAEAFGRFTDSFFCMRIKESIVNPIMMDENVLSHEVIKDGIPYIQVHPTFLYESCWNLAVFLFLILTSGRKRFDGQNFCFYMLLYGFGRFFIEGLRSDSLMLFHTGIKVSQAVSILLVVVGLAGLILGKMRTLRKS